MKPATKEDVLEFIIRAQKVVDVSYRKFMPEETMAIPQLSVMFGKKYARIVMDHGSAWGFINLENGDVLKSASWRAPAKHARGNIFDAHGGVKWVSWTGLAYLK